MNKKENKKLNWEGGQAMLLATVFFLAASITIVLGSTNPVLEQLKISKDTLKSRQSFIASDTGFEDVLYRLKNGMTVASAETLIVGSSTVAVSLSNVTGGKLIVSRGDTDNRIRNTQAKITEGEGFSFNYGLQVGDGGIDMEGGSEIHGNVYSNGSIVGDGGVIITGSAIAANSSPLTADQTNDSPSTPPNGIVFANSSANQDVAQSFVPSVSSKINKVRLYIKKNGSPADLTVSINTNSSGAPSTNELVSADLSASLITSNYGWVEVVFPSNSDLTAGTTYWIVLDGDYDRKDPSKYYTWAANSSYEGGVAKVGRIGDDWNSTSPAGLDAYFSVFVGGIPSEIKGTGGARFNIGTTPSDIAWAPSITFTKTTGSIYCQTGSGNVDSNDLGKNCDTSRPDPSPVPMPISEANIDEWKSQATAGGIHSGDFEVDSSNATSGPLQITGDLYIYGGGTLALTGPLWVKGNVIVTGGGKVVVAFTQGPKSEVMVSDGYMNINGNGEFQGSGASGSYPMLVTTSICPNSSPCAENSSALSLSGGAGAVVLNAPFGKVSINGGSGARAVTGKMISLSGGAEVVYETGLANMNFSSGPSGTWVIDSWKEIE